MVRIVLAPLPHKVHDLIQRMSPGQSELAGALLLSVPANVPDYNETDPIVNRTMGVTVATVNLSEICSSNPLFVNAG